MSMREKLELLQQKRAESEQGGGADRIATQHQKGKMTARRAARGAARPRIVRRARPLRDAPGHRFSGLADQKILGDGW